MSVTITSRAIPSNPRSKNYPSGAIVYNSGDSTTIMQGGGESVDVIGKDDLREMTDKNVLSSLRALAEIRSRIIKKEDNTPTGDDNVFSSLRTLEEVNKVIVSLLEALEERYLSKTRSDRTPYSLEVGEDLTVDGNASVNHDLNVGRNATIGKDLTVMEILRALIKIETASLNVSGNSKTGTLDVAGKATARDVEVANQVTSLNAVIRALATIHNLTVENTADIMHGIIRQYLSSDKFVSGFLGEGFKVWQDAAGLWHGELDMLTVRKTFTVFELVVQKVVHQGGMVIRSAAGGKISKVTDGGSYWRCEHDSTDDFVTNDQVLCQVFTGTKMKRYWRLVTSAGAGYFNLSKTDCEAGSATPEVGDEVAVLGNRTNAARQSAQIDCAVGANAPYRDDYAGINSYSLVGKLVTRTGNLSGIVDPDFGALSGFGLYSLNAYLKGMLRLVSGKTVETAIGEARSGAISVAASDAQAKATAAETNAKTHAQAILDALQIGGRNLISGSGQLRINSGKSLGSNYIPGQQYTISIERSVNISPGIREGKSMMLFCSDVSPYPLIVYIPISESRQVATFTYPQAGKGNLALCATEVWSGTTDVTKLKIEKGAKATDWTPAPEDVEAGIAFEITKVRTDFDVREGQISSKVAEVTAKTQQAVSAAETAKANADASAAKLVAVTQKESNINQTAADIDLKAKRAEQAAGKAEAAEARVNIAADGVVINAAKQAAQLAVDGVQVGGRNLILNSYFSKDTLSRWGKSADGNYTLSVDNGELKVVGAQARTGTDLNSSWNNSWCVQPLSFNDNGEYTLSFDAHALAECTLYFRANFFSYPNQGGALRIGTAKRRYSITFGNKYYNASRYLGFVFDKATALFIDKVKLEKGNKATDWTPAPENMEADAQAKADAAKQSAINDAAAKYPTKTEYSAQLAVLNHSISSKVSQTDFSALGTRMSAAEQKITPGAINMVVKEQITTAVDGLRIGGRNLVLNSARVVTGTTRYELSKSKQQLKGKTLTISFEYEYSGVSTGSVYNKARFGAELQIKTEGSSMDYSRAWVNLPLNSTGLSGRGRRESTVTIPANATDDRDYTYLHVQVSTGSVKMWNFKIEEGTKATDWSPAPEDVQADIALRPTKEEIKAGISMTSGGIDIFGKVISLAGKVTFASLDASTQATINGKATTASLTALQNRLGAMAYQNMVSLAKLDNTIVQGGYIKTSLIEARSITADKIAAGAITADKLDVGSVQAAIVTADAVNALNITAKKIQSAQGTFDRIEGVSGQDSMLLTSSLIRFKNSHTSVFIGADTMPAWTGGMMVTPVRIHVERAMPSYHMGANAGLYLSVAGAKLHDDFVGSGNHALFIPKGGICGMRLQARRIGANTTLSVMDSIVFVIKTGVTVTLPDSGVEDGQIYFIRNHCGGTCRIAGNNIRAWNDGGVGNSFEVNRSNMAILMYDAHNNTWTANWTGNW